MYPFHLKCTRSNLILRLLSYFHPARLMNADERTFFVQTWEAELKNLKAYPPQLAHLKPAINAKILWLSLKDYTSLSTKVLYHLLSSESAVLLLSNPFLSMQEFSEALFFVATNLPQKYSLQDVLEKTVDKLAQICTAVSIPHYVYIGLLMPVPGRPNH